MKWYTAIGRKKEKRDKSFCVVANGKEKILTEMESFLWVSLLWRFLTEENIHDRVEHMLAITFFDGEKKVSQEDVLYCLNRLESRGLIVKCKGETMEEVAAGMMRQAVLEPSRMSFYDRFHAFWMSMRQGRGISFSFGAFTNLCLKKEERMLLQGLHICGEVDAHLMDIKESVETVCRVSTVEKEIIEKNMERKFFGELLYLYRKKQLTIQSVKGEVSV